MFLFWPLPVQSTEGEVEIDFKPDLRETHYCIGATECRLCWTTSDTDLHRGITTNRSHCSRPLSTQLPDLSRLLDQILSQNPQTPFPTLFWGRLTPDTPKDDLQMAQRLALAAFRSSQWDRRSGKPRTGNINLFVRQLLNSTEIYPELDELFSRFNKKIGVSDVEKVLVTTAEKLPFYKALHAQGISTKDKLPFDAMVWFSISDR
jgi:hypothetical protein